MAIPAICAMRDISSCSRADGNTRMAPVDRKGTDHPSVRGDDGCGPGGSQERMPRPASRRNSHNASVSMSATVDLTCQVHGGGAGAVADADGRAIHRRHELARQIRRDTEIQRLPLSIQQVDRAIALRQDALDQGAYRPERRGQRRIGGDLLEYPALARCYCIAARLLSVMSVMLARIIRRLELGKRTNRTSQGMTCPAASQCAPLEHRRFARERALYEAARRPEGRRAVGLVRGTDLIRAAGEQGFARHLEKAAGVVVDIDEPALVDIEYHDHFGACSTRVL